MDFKSCIVQTNKFHKLLLVLVYNIPPVPVTWWKVVNISPCNREGVYVWPLWKQMWVAGPGPGFIPRTEAVEDRERSPALITRHLYLIYTIL